MQKNVGHLDAHIRISVGLIMVAMGIVKKSLLLIIPGSCKVSEGVTRFCPILYMLNISTCGNKS